MLVGRRGDAVASSPAPRPRRPHRRRSCSGRTAFLMVYARAIPFHGLLMPTAASFAALMGGSRWGWWTLAVASATWLAPVARWRSPALQTPVDIVWPSQYFRIWFFHTSLTAGVVATIGHVTRHLEAAVEHRGHAGRAGADRGAGRAGAGRPGARGRGERAPAAGARAARRFRPAPDGAADEAAAVPAPPDQRTAAIDDCVAISEELLHDVRAFARGLRPPLLDEVGLGPALQALVDAHVDRQAFVVTLDVPEGLPACRRRSSWRRIASSRRRSPTCCGTRARAACRWRPAATATSWQSC